MKNFLTTILASFCSIALGGGIIGGGNPSVQLESTELISLQDSALNGDLIRIKEPGRDPVHLRPDISSMKLHSLRANVLPSGQEIIFHSEPEAMKIQNKMTLSLARSAIVSTGVLPVLPTDFLVKPRIMVDTVAQSDLDKETLDRITRPAADPVMGK
ncbi:MAG: hypothetical protein M3Q07_22190 [Pseudobdellovibrionaceae bacterium]|nr:hypothetical protein [Pseudobdellovibrionaceae bacterium]